MPRLLENTDRGLYCAAGDFYIDPWKPVDRAVVTHAHSDHARSGSRHYLAAAVGESVLRKRIGTDSDIQAMAFGQSVDLNGVRVSLHPAGHILGSAQVRIERGGEVWVASGDYKTTPDATCDVFVPQRCHVFITESTFGLPIYRWRPTSEIFDQMNAWWRSNQERGRTSIIYAYSLGKSQRVLSGLDESIGPILVHGAVDSYLEAYKAAGVKLPATQRATTEAARDTRGRAMVVAPPGWENTPWVRKFGETSSAMASGWMQIRGARRRRAMDRGFILSDHADWPELLSAIAATGAEEVWPTHGYTSVMVRWLEEQGLKAQAIATRFEGEMVEEPVDGDESAGPDTPFEIEASDLAEQNEPAATEDD